MDVNGLTRGASKYFPLSLTLFIAECCSVSLCICNTFLIFQGTQIQFQCTLAGVGQIVLYSSSFTMCKP